MGLSYRSQGRVLSCTNTPRLSTSIGYKDRRSRVQVQDPEFRFIPSSVDIYKDHQAGDDHPTQGRNNLFLLYRRFYHPRRYRGSGQWMDDRDHKATFPSIRSGNQRRERSIKGCSKPRISRCCNRSKAGVGIDSQAKGIQCKEKVIPCSQGLSKRKVNHDNEDRGKHCRDTGSIRSSSYISTSILKVGSSVNQGWQGSRIKMVPAGEVGRRGSGRYSFPKGCYTGKQWTKDKSIDESIYPIHGCKFLRLGSLSTRSRLRIRILDQGSIGLAHQPQGIKSGPVSHRIIQMGGSYHRKGSSNHDRLNGSLLLHPKWRRKEEGLESNCQGYHALRDKPRYQACDTGVDIHRSKPSRLTIQVDRPGRLAGLRGVFQKDLKRVGLRSKYDCRSFRGHSKPQGNPVQQLGVLSGYRSRGCVLPRLGKPHYSYKLARSAVQTDPKNPFVHQGVSSTRDNHSTKMGCSTMVAGTNRYAISKTDRAHARGIINRTIRTDGALLKSIMGDLSLPDKWFEMTPLEVRSTKHWGLRKDSTLINVSLEGLVQFALNRDLNAFAAAIQAFIDHAKDQGLDPNDKIQAMDCTRSFLSTGIRGELLLAIRVAYLSTKIWDFDPVEEALVEEQVGIKYAPKDLNTLISLGRSQATLRIYQREWDGYYRFTVSQNLDMRSFESLSKYIVSLWIEGMISKALAVIMAVKKGSLMLRWDISPTDHFLIQEAKKALYKLKAQNASEFKRDPLPAVVIVGFVTKVWEEGLQENPYFIRCCAVLLTGFRLMLRSKSLAGITIKDLSFKDWGVEVALAPIKGMTSWQRKHIETSSDYRLCPVYWLKKLCYIYQDDNTTLIFGRLDRSGPLTSIELTEIVRKAAGVCGDDGDYSSHSLRIGGATAAALGGLSVTTIQSIGGWESLAVLRYIRSIIGVQKRASEKMGLVSDPKPSIPLL